jgi:hypothetical protein
VWSSAVIEHGKGPTIPWIRLKEPHGVQALNDEILAPPILPLDIGEHVDGFLREIASVEKEVTHVTCEVSINVEKEEYDLEFKDKVRETVRETLHFKNTTELVKALRHPVTEGTPLRIKKKSLVMWDHQRDIRYLGCELMRGRRREIVSISFLRPLVHRSRFHPEAFLFPKTCHELLSTIGGKGITLTIRPRENRFNVELKGLSPQSSLRLFEGLEMNVFDMALLVECEQLIDTTGKVRYDVEIDARHLSEFMFSQIDRYPRLQKAVSRLVRTEFDWTKGEWSIVVEEAQNGSDVVFWTIRSVKSGRVWMDRSFSFELDYSKTLQKHVQVFKETVRETIPLEHLSEFSGTIVRLERTLRSKGLGEGKPRCRFDLEVREGKNVAVINRIVPDGGLSEIDSFPIETYDLEGLEELILADGGPLSYYEAVNLEEFYDSVRRMMSGVKETERDEDNEGAELLRVISEYRQEQDKRGLGQALVILAKRRLSQDRTVDAMTTAAEAITLLRECDPDNRLVRSYIADALVVKAEVLMKGERPDTEMTRNLLHEAKETVTALLDSLSPGSTDVIVQETSDRIDRLLQQLDTM